MFGLLALGFFASLAFSGLFGDKNNSGKGGSNSEGGFGQKLLGFLGVSKFSDIFMGNGNTAASSTKDDTKDDKKDEDKNNELNFNKSLALMQNQIDNAKEGEDKDEALKTYNEMLGCMYDDEGNKLSQEEIQKKLDGNKKLKEKLEKQALIAAKDEKLANQFKENANKITDAQANAAAENAVAAHLENVKQQKLNDETDDAKKAEIKKKYDKMIEEHKAAAKKIGDIAAVDADIKKLEQEQSELQEQERKLSDPDAVKKEIEKCGEINWDDSQCDKGDLTGEDAEKKKAAEEFLKSQGVDVELYKKYEAVQSDKNKNKDLSNNEELKTTAQESIDKRKKEINNKIDENEKAIKSAKNKRDKIEKGEKPEAEQNNDNSEGNNNGEQNTKEDNSFEDEDGVKYYEKDGKYCMEIDGDVDDTLSKEDFEKAKENAVDDEQEGDERIDNDGDLEKDEVDDKGNSKKDPRKIYKRRTYKRGDKTFKTKSYYNKDGNSISAKEFKEKVANFDKSKKQKEESLYISNFLKGKMLNEHLVPKKTIQQYLREQFA